MSGDSDDTVGYRKPPRQHRIRTYEVRNPWGRRGKPKPKVDFLDEPFELKFDGRKQSVTRRDAIDYALFNAAQGR